MRQRVIAMLDFPRNLVRAEMDLFECPHNGEFDSRDHVCIECADGPECKWLYATDSVAALDSRPISQLSEALEFAILSVASSAVEKGHDPKQCDCQMCTWIQQAEVLCNELQRQ